MKSFSAVTLLAVAAVASAQSSSSSAASSTSTASPLIPSGISSGCSSYLQELNSNTTFTIYLSTIVDATTAFGPLGSSSGTFSAGDVSSALNTLCSTTSPTAAIHSQLAMFYSACSGDISNTDVRTTYEVLYMLAPFQAAVCSKGDSGQYCISTLSSGSSSASGSASGSATSSSPAASSSAPAKRAETTTNVTEPIVPNTDTFRKDNVAFLMFPSTVTSAMCNTCLRNVLSAYIAAEEAVPYGPGDISQSPMLGNQNDLYNSATSVCGSNFLTGSVQAAGGLGDGIVAASGAIPNVGAVNGLLGAAAAGFISLAFL